MCHFLRHEKRNILPDQIILNKYDHMSYYQTRSDHVARVTTCHKIWAQGKYYGSDVPDLRILITPPTPK